MQREAAGDGGVAIDDKMEPHEVGGPDRDGGGEHDMMFEDLEAEFVDMPVMPRSRLDAACVRKDAAEIVNGAQRPFPPPMPPLSFSSFSSVSESTPPERQGAQIRCASSDVLQDASMPVLDLRRHRHSAPDRRRRTMASPQRG